MADYIIAALRIVEPIVDGVVSVYGRFRGSENEPETDESEAGANAADGANRDLNDSDADSSE